MLRLASALACLLLVFAGTAPVAAAGTDVAVPGAAASPAVDATSPTTDTAPTLQQGGSLSLTVTDDEDPVAGAEVTLYRDGERVLAGETGDDGSLDTGPIENGAYRVQIREPGYDERSVSVTVDGETARSVALEADSVELTVDVTDARTGDPLGDAVVDVDAVGTVRTAPDGIQTVRVPVNSEVGLTVTKDGYEHAALTVAVGESAQSVDLEIARETRLSLSLGTNSVDAGDSVTATVTDAYGDPVAGATLLLDGAAVAETGADGTASVPVENGGDHTVRARAGDTLSDPKPLTAAGTVGTATPTETATGAANGTATPATTGTATANTESGTATPIPTATPTNESGDSAFAALPFSVPEVPELRGSSGPLGLLPPIRGSARIVLVLAGIGAVGLVLSVLREDEL